MDIDTLIDMLKDYCKDSNKSDDKEILFWVKYGRNIVKISAKK